MEEKRDEIIVEKMLTDNRVVDSVNDILVELDRAEKEAPGVAGRLTTPNGDTSGKGGDCTDGGK